MAAWVVNYQPICMIWLSLQEPFLVACKRCTNPLAHGWYAVVLMCLTPNMFTYSWNNTDWNCAPLSLIMTKVTPYIVISCFRMFLATVSAEMSLIGNVASHLLKRSSIGNGFNNINIQFSKPSIGFVEMTWWWFCMSILCFWHLLKLCAHCWISLCMSIQTKWPLTSLAVARLPGCDKLWKWSKICCQRNVDGI